MAARYFQVFDHPFLGLAIFPDMPAKHLTVPGGPTSNHCPGTAGATAEERPLFILAAKPQTNQVRYCRFKGGGEIAGCEACHGLLGEIH